MSEPLKAAAGKARKDGAGIPGWRLLAVAIAGFALVLGGVWWYRSRMD